MESNEKTRQNAENKQSIEWKIEMEYGLNFCQLMEKLVKTLKINKLGLTGKIESNANFEK